MTRKIVTAQAKVFDDRFGDGLKAVRESLGVKRSDLSKRCGLPGYTIAQIETAYGKKVRRRATIGEAIVLAEALGVKPGDLMRGHVPEGAVRGTDPAPAAGPELTQKIRDWARGEGIAVEAAGPVPKKIRDLYEQAVARG